MATFDDDLDASVESPDIKLPTMGSPAQANAYGTNLTFEDMQDGVVDPENLAQEHQQNISMVGADVPAHLERNRAIAIEDSKMEQAALAEGFISGEIEIIRDDLEVLLADIPAEAKSDIAPYVVETRREMLGGTKDDIARGAVKHRVAAEIAALEGAQTGFEEGYNTFKFFAAPTSLFDTPGTVFGPEGIHKFQQMDGVDQIRMLPYVLEEAMNRAGGNAEKAQDMLSKLMDVEGSERTMFENTLEALALPFVVGDAVKLLGWAGGKILASSAVAKLNSQSVKAANRELAGRLVATGIKDKEFAAAMNKTLNELVGDASPFNFGKFEASSIDGVSNEVVTALQQTDHPAYMAMMKALMKDTEDALNLAKPIATDSIQARASYNKAFEDARVALRNQLDNTPTPLSLEIEPIIEDGVLGWAIRTRSPDELIASLPRTALAPDVPRPGQIGDDAIVGSVDTGDLSRIKAEGFDLGLIESRSAELEHVDTIKLSGLDAANEVIGKGSDQWAVFQKWTPKFDDVTGLMQLPDVGVIGKALASPAGNLSGQEAAALINSAQIGQAASGKLNASYQSALKFADEPVKGRGFKKSRANVDAALEFGDENTKVFAPHDIVDQAYTNPRTGAKIQLTEKEYESYMLKRSLADYTHMLNDSLLTKTLNLQGFKSSPSLVSEGGASVFKEIPRAKTVQRLSEELATATKAGKPVPKVYNESTDKFEDIQQLIDRVDGMLDNQMLVDSKAYSPFYLGERGKVSLALVSRNSVQDVPRGLKPWRAGYMPKNNLGGEYAVVFLTKGMRDGNEVAGATRELVELTSTRNNAEGLVESLTKKKDLKDFKDGTTTEGFYEFVDDYEDILAVTDPNNMKNVGKHRGSRKKDAVMLDGARAAREPAGLALSKQLDQIGRTAPLEEWKLFAEDQWVKSVNADPRIATPVDHIDDAMGALATQGEGGVEAVRSAEFMRDYIKSVTMTRSQGEKVFEDTVRRIAKASEDWLPSAATKSAYWVSHTNPVNAAKAISFNSFLGFMNPAQLWVQAQIASIAASIHPILGVKASARALPILYSFFTKNTNVVEMTFRAAKNAGLKGASLEDFELIRKSGLLDTLTRIGEGSANIRSGHGYTAANVQKALSAGQLPYKIGEAYGRIVSWLIAKDELLASGAISKTRRVSGKKFPGSIREVAQRIQRAEARFNVLARKVDDAKKLGKRVDPHILNEQDTLSKHISTLEREAAGEVPDIVTEGFSKADLDKIFTRTNEYTLQMTNVNQAAWQKGIWGIPTQFMQVQTKMIESFLPVMFGGKSTFTGFEKTKLFLGQAMFYGAAGVPFGNWMLEWAASQSGVSPRDINENVLNAMRGGIMSLITGGEVSAASRGAVAAGIQSTLENIALGDGDMWRIAGGAFGSIFGKVSDTFNTMVVIATAEKTTATDVVVGLTGFLETVSTFKNARIALQYMWKQQQYLRSNGVPVPHQFSTLEIVAQGLGFRPQLIEDMHTIVENDRERKERLNDISNRIVKLYNVMRTSRDDHDAYEAALSEIKLWSAGKGYDVDHIALMKIVHNKIFNGVGREGEIALKALVQETYDMANALGVPVVDKLAGAALQNRLDKDQ